MSKEIPETHVLACIATQEEEYQLAIEDPSRIKNAVAISRTAVISGKNRNPSLSESETLDKNLDRIISLEKQYESK